MGPVLDPFPGCLPPPPGGIYGGKKFSQVTVTWKNFCHTATYFWVLPPDPLVTKYLLVERPMIKFSTTYFWVLPPDPLGNKLLVQTGPDTTTEP